MLQQKSYAKINLFLYVTDKRGDGYHNIFSLFAKINLYDLITVKRGKKFEIKCNDKTVPLDKRNLIWKVYEKIKDKISPVEVILYKKIPSEAGLGGGSSNAATFLKIVNKMFDLALSKKDMAQILKDISADAPFFLEEDAAICGGIGDKIIEKVELPKLPLLLVKPRFGMSTQKVYGSKNLRLTSAPQINNICTLSNVGLLKSYVHNDLEQVVLNEHNELKMVKAEMLKLGAFFTLMSGSGTTFFGVYPSLKLLDKAYLYFMDNYKGYFVYKTNIL